MRIVHAGPTRAWLIFALAFIAVPLLLNEAIAAAHFPNYGTWTGIRPLEAKLRLLGEFAADGPPDGLVLGSSISDLGFNAELFSKLVSQGLGRPYRLFNFSSGATELVTMPKLYRLARTVTRPRQLFILVPASLKRPNEAPPRSPDYIMAHAPVQLGLMHPWLLPFDKWLWDLPLLSGSTAARDSLMYGRLANFAAQEADLYRIDAFGDTLSFNYQVADPDLQRLRESHRTLLRPLSPARLEGMSLQQRLEFFFTQSDIAAMRELRQLTEADGVNLVVVAHSVAATFYPTAIPDDDYYRVRQQFYSALTEALNARLINDLEGFSVPQYAVNDSFHLNQYGGRLFAARIAGDFVQDPALREAEPTLPQAAYPSVRSDWQDDPTIGTFASLIPTPNQPDAHVLRLRFIHNDAVPAIPMGRLFVAAREPDGRDVVVPAGRTSDDTIEAPFETLPGPGRNLLFVRLLGDVGGGGRVALNEPLSDYAWQTDLSPQALAATRPVRVSTDTTSTAVGSAIGVSWSGSLSNSDWIGMFSVPDDTRQEWKYVSCGNLPDASVPAGTCTFTPRIAGTYEFRMYSAGGWNLLTASPPVTVTPPATRLAVSAQTAPVGGSLAVSWSGSDSAADWIGMFSMQDDTREEWKYVSCTNAIEAAVPAGSCSFVPTKAGTYEFQMYANGGWILLAATDAVVITPSQALVSVRDGDAAPGERTRVSWVGASSPDDWIGLFQVGQDARLDFQFVRACAADGKASSDGTCSFSLPATPGVYEFRLYANGDWSELARSSPITVH